MIKNNNSYADGAAGAIGKIHAFEKFGSILGLERMTELLALLGDPQDKLKVIHVAGTNGKGSVCRYIYSVLQENGYRAGLYTSPFLEVFNERIELDGAYISDEDLTVYTDRVLEQVQVMVDAGKQSPTEFEVITAIAFLYFYEKGADYVVLEVGLGGRGDSTNVCKEPLISVITSISYDHTDRLGSTLAQIAWEKAGIIKDGCPVVTSAKAPEALEVIERTAAEHGSLFFETKGIPYRVKSQSLHGSCFDVDFQGVIFEDLTISMAGEHQIENAIAALAAISLLEERGELCIRKEKLYSGFRKAKQIGRFEVLTAPDAQPVVILDGAHNPDGAKVLRKAVRDFCPQQKILMVTGMLADKDTAQILECFRDIADDFIATEPVNPRRMKKEILKARLEAAGARCITAADAEDAAREAIQYGADYDVILFAGSLYLIGQVRSVLRGLLADSRTEGETGV